MSAQRFSIIKEALQESVKVLEGFLDNPSNLKAIDVAANLMITAFKSGGKVFSCGNGGSHCDAMHFAEELTGRFRDDRQALPAIAISDGSHLSCVANDYGYQYVFSRFIEALGASGDILLAISTSGNSINVINAVKAARLKNMKVVLLTGKDGGKLLNTADVQIIVNHLGYADRIQEIHIKVIHIMIQLIEVGMLDKNLAKRIDSTSK